VASRLNPYITFAGTAREAMEFYKEVFGGTLRLNTFGEYGNDDPATANQIMHAQLETDSGYTLMASDIAPGAEHKPGDTITISLSGEDAEELRGYWEKLSSSGTITMPLEKQMWGDEFGQCIDRYGIAWMVDIVEQES
jgi:PhnB protein